MEMSRFMAVMLTSTVKMTKMIQCKAVNLVPS